MGVHAAKLIGVDAETYLKSEDLMFEGLCKAIELYKPDGIPVSFDLQMEAEILGCGLVWSKDNPPSVSTHPMGEGGTQTLDDMFIPQATDGRIPITLNVAKRLREKYPDLALYGLITGPFTLALHLCGTDIFMNMFMDVEGVHKTMSFCVDVCAMSRYYIEAGCDIVAVVDPMCSQIGADQFEQFILEPCKQVFENIRELGALSSFFVCGHAQHNIEVMCQCKPDNISIDENIPLDFVRDICLKHNICYGGNLKLTVVLLMGDEDDTRRNVVECLDVAAAAGGKGFILAPGCDLAYATPEQNLVACAELVRDEYQQDIVRALGEKKVDVEPLDLSAYLEPNVVKVDCVTLDAAGCAACQYMWEATLRGAEPFGDSVVVVERSVKTPEGVAFMASAGVTNIPTLVIDGEIVFVSNIPPVDKITEAIQKAFDRKK